MGGLTPTNDRSTSVGRFERRSNEPVPSPAAAGEGEGGGTAPLWSPRFAGGQLSQDDEWVLWVRPPRFAGGQRLLWVPGFRRNPE